MQLPERALQGIDLAFVVDLLSLREFEGLQHFLHFIEHVFQFVDDPRDLIDRVSDAGRLRRRWRGGFFGDGLGNAFRCGVHLLGPRGNVGAFVCRRLGGLALRRPRSASAGMAATAASAASTPFALP